LVRENARDPKARNCCVDGGSAAPRSSHSVSVDEETVVQLNNIGPWELAYSDPKEDPRRKPK